MKISRSTVQLAGNQTMQVNITIKYPLVTLTCILSWLWSYRLLCVNPFAIFYLSQRVLCHQGLGSPCSFVRAKIYQLFMYSISMVCELQRRSRSPGAGRLWSTLTRHCGVKLNVFHLVKYSDRYSCWFSINTVKIVSTWFLFYIFYCKKIGRILAMLCT